MTVIANPISIWNIFDRGLSEDAQGLRLNFDEASHCAHTRTLGIPEEALYALEIALKRAATETQKTDECRVVEDTTIQYAYHFLSMLGSSTPTPDIYAEQDGDLAFEWDEGRRSVFSVSVSRDGTLTFAGLFGQNKIYGTEILKDNVPLVITQGIGRTLNPAS